MTNMRSGGLAAADRKRAVKRVVQREPANGGGKRRIVVIDDDPDILFLYKTRLELRGYEVVGETCPDEARWVIREKQPDLIILDLMMPGVSGFDLLVSLPYEFGMRKIPILILTSADDPGLHVQARRLGAADVFLKGRDDHALLLKADELTGALRTD